MTQDTSRLHSGATIEIALDAVLFADGSAIGPDTEDQIPKWKAWNEAEKEVYTKVASVLSH